jgi:hypothetical protein
MHDPLVVAFTIRRPWPTTSRPRNLDGTLAKPHRYRPALITVWHREPGGHDSGEICKHTSRYQDRDGKWQWRFHHAWRFHIWHWHVQLHGLQALRRRLLTRCTWCNGRSTKGDQVSTSNQWDGERGPWWRGERGLFHGDCSGVASAHSTCVCENPQFDHDGWGRCARCDQGRSYGMTAEGLAIQRALRQVPVGGRRPKERP